ncbi:hypothetical protein HYT91_03210 [Candidatus Pacearchaeota archaeon]|nr:hypothetical protein [Candidatus Pacearchaeota archaeon]
MDFRNSTDVFDNSTYNNFGTISGAVANSSGKRGGSFTFDGVNDRINIDTAVGDLSTTTKGTWSAWVKPTDATVSSVFVIMSFVDNVGQNSYMSFYQNPPLFRWYVDSCCPCSRRCVSRFIC